jgi:transcriptional regulator with XRE-family HTH domain
MSEPTPNLPPPPKHPLQQLREILGWSREQCAKETGLKASTIQNIERGAAPLPEEAAFAIEAATSCNAMELGLASEVWRRTRDENPDIFKHAGRVDSAHEMFAPKTLNGSRFTKDIYEGYKQAALEPQSVEKAIEDLSRRVRLLLGPLEQKPEKFRRLYRYLVQVMNKTRKEAGPDEAEMTNYAMRSGTAKLEECTVKELSERPEIVETPVWKKSNPLGRFKPDEKVHIVRETYTFWPFTEVVGGKGHYVTPDYAFGSRTVYRITLPDGKMVVVAQNHVESGGLEARLADGLLPVMPEVPPSPETSPTDAAPSASASTP